MATENAGTASLASEEEGAHGGLERTMYTRYEGDNEDEDERDEIGAGTVGDTVSLDPIAQQEQPSSSEASFNSSPSTADHGHLHEPSTSLPTSVTTSLIREDLAPYTGRTGTRDHSYGSGEIREEGREGECD